MNEVSIFEIKVLWIFNIRIILIKDDVFLLNRELKEFLEQKDII